MGKICPILWLRVGEASHCIKDSCEWYIKGKCAVALIAQSSTEILEKIKK